ncbi:MAG: hypothetical protein IT167_29535 [Bryobacterales bacterium]|nr:hypothetical protein [Bryobacterales bacterium]
MSKTLQSQLPLLSLSGLRDFGAAQSERLNKFLELISGANAEMAKIEADAKPFFSGATRTVGNTTVRVGHPADAPIQAQVIERKSKVRTALDAQLRPLFKAMLAASTVAKEYADRHWSLPQVLNRATTGNGALEGLTRRASYATIFEKIGKAQLFDFGQLAIDTGDAVLADSVYRAAMTRPREERPFQPAEFISLLRNSDHTEATTILQKVLDDCDKAGTAMAEFEGQTGRVNLNMITAGLQKQGRIPAAHDLLDEAGGIREEALIQFAAKKGR